MGSAGADIGGHLSTAPGHPRTGRGRARAVPGGGGYGPSLRRVALHRVERGDGPRVVLVHGFTQTLASWRPVADDLAADHRVVLVDAPGHGASAAVRADLATTAGLLAEAGGRAV